MKKFNVTINGKPQLMFADSIGKLKGILRRQLNKRRLAGVEIIAINNNHGTKLKPLTSFKRGESCEECGETRPEELTIDDSLIARKICNSCLDKKDKPKISIKPKQLNLFL